MVELLFRLTCAINSYQQLVDNTAVTETQIIAALDAELERLFDARVGAASSSGALHNYRPGRS